MEPTQISANFETLWTNKVLVKENVNFTMPMLSDASAFDDLANQIFCYDDGTLHPETGYILDRLAPNWQLALLAWYTQTYNQFDSLLNAFPYHIKYPDDTILAYWDGETDCVMITASRSSAPNLHSISFEWYYSLSRNRFINSYTFSYENFATFSAYKYSGQDYVTALFELMVYNPANQHIYLTYSQTQASATHNVVFSENPGSRHYSITAEENDFFIGAVENFVPAPVDTDPFAPGGTSETGGGTGTFTDTGDAIDFPGLPTLSAVDTGFITLFNPTTAQLKNLASYMWSNPLFDLEAWRKLFADPMDAVLGLSIVPVAVPDGGIKEVTVGNLGTGISMNAAATQYVAVDCGTLNVQEYWGAYLDYSPYTKCYIYLPYIGTHPINVDDIMNKSVHVMYHIDILSGACTAFVKCGDSVMYEFIGQCASSIPITGDNFTNVINGVLGIAGSIGTMVAVGGLTAGTAVTGVGVAAAGSAVASMAQDVMAMKPAVEKSGAMGGTGGMLGVQTPYMILERPKQAIPSRQNDFMGYPSFTTQILGNLSGYTEVEIVHLTGIPCTNGEKDEIETLLKGGVLL